MDTNVNVNYIKCMVQPPDYSQAAFDNARQGADKFLCPEVMNVKLTEVRMEQYSNIVISYQSKFIELYNSGTSAIDLAQYTLKVNGFITSDSFGKATINSACTITIQPQKYLVIYDNSLDVAECPNCNCSYCGICSCDSTLSTYYSRKFGIIKYMQFCSKIINLLPKKIRNNFCSKNRNINLLFKIIIPIFAQNII